MVESGLVVLGRINRRGTVERGSRLEVYRRSTLRSLHSIKSGRVQILEDLKDISFPSLRIGVFFSIDLLNKATT